jgi:hypothetical protein
LAAISKNGDTLTFTPPEGRGIASTAAKLTFISSNEIDYQFNDGNDPGTWSVRVNSPDSARHSSSVSFTVSSSALDAIAEQCFAGLFSGRYCHHALQLFGSDFENGDTLTFTPPEGGSIASTAAKLTFISSNEIDYQFNDGNDPGTWSVRVKQPRLSAPFQLSLVHGFIVGADAITEQCFADLFSG